MTDAEVREAIEGGETFTVEFKGEESEPINDRELIETVVCLANGDGGTLLIGVEDDGRVTGARPRHEAGTTDPDRLKALIANNTEPPVRVEVDLIAVDGEMVLAIGVPNEARAVGTRDARYIRRALGGDGRPACIPLHATEMLAHQIERGAVDYAALEIPEARWEDLDPLEFERLRRLIRESGGDDALTELSDAEIAKALGVVVANGEIRSIRAGALLLFGREKALRRFLPTHEVAFQVLSGTDVEVNDFFRWPLFRVADELLSRFRARNTEEEIQSGLLRIGIPEYPEASFREAVANALVHRDYTRLGAVHVQWQDASLEISNPGGLPAGINLDNLLVAPPRPRNPILADAFKRAGLVERTGRGVNRIYEGQLRYGRGAPDYSRSTWEDVVVVLSGGQANLALTRYVVEQAQAGRPLSLEALIIVNELIRERRVTTAHAATLFQRDESTARQLLNRLVDRGLLEARGEARGRTYHLSAAAYRAIGEDVAYVRVHGFEPLQQEQMILSYVDAHGQITRGQAAELCQVAPRQARAVLKRLVARGELRLIGQRRRARYERPS
ncbi:MAG: putative DNA binding domain-containing protein [Thermoleophilia bacterium]|nr:putative DNA binding domain-containing protein [Thermoleophilia bacterium]